MKLPAAPTTIALKVMTYNVEMGLNWSSTLDVIRRCDADILCLQEVVPPDYIDPDSTSVERMRADLGDEGDLQYLWRRGRKRIGNLTIARGEIEAVTVLHSAPMSPYGMVSRVRFDDFSVLVANLHLSPMHGWPPLMFLPTELLRMRQIRHFNKWVAEADEPVIVTGDFNSFPGAPAMGQMRDGWTSARDTITTKMPGTRPTYGIRFVIDHIFTRGATQIRNYDVIIGGGSDHRAVVATVDFPLG